jgi:hypothetical protein
VVRAPLRGRRDVLPKRRYVMKAIVFTLIALSVLIGVSTPGFSDPKSFWEQRDRFSGGSNGR